MSTKFFILLLFLLCTLHTILTHSCNGDGSSLHCPDYIQTELLLDQNLYKDLWGYKINWTDLDKGWTQFRRKKVLLEREKIQRQRNEVPHYTKNGLKKMKMPKGFHKYLLDLRNDTVIWPESCLDESPNYHCQNGIAVNMRMLGLKGNISEAVRTIINSVKPELELWSGQKLSDAGTCYGIRRYLHGSQLGLHVDRLPTHILSVILQIDQRVNKEWPLMAIDLKDKRKKIFLKPGEMLLYESATVPHGRMEPLNGDYFDNLFVHFYPKQY